MPAGKFWVTFSHLVETIDKKKHKIHIRMCNKLTRKPKKIGTKKWHTIDNEPFLTTPVIVYKTFRFIFTHI